MSRTLSIGGPETPGVHFPAGTAMMLQPGERVVIQLHLLNASTAPREFAPVAAHLLRAQGDLASLQPVGVLLVNDSSLDLPAKSSGLQFGVDCSLPESLDNIFMIWPHMHLLGRRLNVGVGDQTLVDVPTWSFDDQKLHPVSAKLPVGASMKLRCRYDNTTGERVKFGMKTSDEMCSAFVYYWPARNSAASVCGVRPSSLGGGL
jgi:hypothetical protein